MKNNSLYDIEYFQKMKSAHNNKLKRARVRNIIVGVFLLIIIVYLITPISKINSIDIKGNKNYTQQQIKKYAKVSENQFSLLHPSFVIKNNLNKSNLFKNVKVTKDLLSNTTIEIKENNIIFYAIEKEGVVFYDEQNNRLKFDDKTSSNLKANSPQLVGNVNAKVKQKMVEKLNQLDSTVLSLISQIQYIPKSYDDEYFRFIMSDAKKVYINASLDDIVKVGANYHNFAANTKYKCSVIEFINTENKAIVKKC